MVYFSPERDPSPAARDDKTKTPSGETPEGFCMNVYRDVQNSLKSSSSNGMTSSAFTDFGPFDA